MVVARRRRRHRTGVVDRSGGNNHRSGGNDRNGGDHCRSRSHDYRSRRDHPADQINDAVGKSETIIVIVTTVMTVMTGERASSDADDCGDQHCFHFSIHNFSLLKFFISFGKVFTFHPYNV